MKKINLILLCLLILSMVAAGCSKKAPAKPVNQKEVKQEVQDKSAKDIQSQFDMTKDNNAEDESYKEDGDSKEEEEEEDESMASYEDAKAVPISGGYPEDIVPLYSKGKIIDSSRTPSKDVYMVEMIIPEGSYKNAVSFYKSSLKGMTPANFKSEVMESETFKGKIDKWQLEVVVAQIPSAKRSFVSISLQTK